MKLVPSSLEYFDLWLKWRNEPNTKRYGIDQDFQGEGIGKEE